MIICTSLRNNNKLFFFVVTFLNSTIKMMILIVWTELSNIWEYKGRFTNQFYIPLFNLILQSMMKVHIYLIITTLFIH